MRAQVLTVTEDYVSFDISDPIPEVVVLDSFEQPSFKGSIKPGSIPYGVKQVDAAHVVVEKLIEGAIPNSVTHLFINTLNANTVIPSSVKHLFVLNFETDMTEFVPKTVKCLYIHCWDCSKAPQDWVHYLYIRVCTWRLLGTEDSRYEYDEEYHKSLFDSSFSVVKRTPKTMSASIGPTLTVGKTYTELIIDDSVTDTLKVPCDYTGLLRPGSIPIRVSRVIFKGKAVTVLEPGVITDSVTHLSVMNLTDEMAIPASVKHLAVMNFKSDMISYVPSTVTHLYVHVTDRMSAPQDRVHYLFYLLHSSAPNLKTLGAGRFDVSLSEDKPFKCMKTIVKRVPVEVLTSKDALLKVPVEPRTGGMERGAIPAPNSCVCSNQVLTAIAGLDERITALAVAVEILGQARK